MQCNVMLLLMVLVLLPKIHQMQLMTDSGINEKTWRRDGGVRYIPFLSDVHAVSVVM